MGISSTPMCLGAAAAGLIVSLLPISPPVQAAPPPSPRPNIVLIVTDDQTHSTFNRSINPAVFERIADRGILFERGYVNTPLCCPSRAQILTGLYAHHTGVDGNSRVLNHPTVVEMLKDEGYNTLLAGKYLNSLRCHPRAEFDRFFCSRRKGLLDSTFYIDGVKKRIDGYHTETLAAEVEDFVSSAAQDEPYFVLYSPISPHLPANDDRYDGMSVPVYRPTSFDAAPVVGEAPGYAARGPLTEEEVAEIDYRYGRMARAARALDDSIARVLDAVDARGGPTLIFFISDNGYLYGEHRLKAKSYPYQEAVRVPFAVALQGFPDAREGVVSDALVSNVDIVPTIADALDREWQADGRSLLPLLTGGAAPDRDALLIEHCYGDSPPCIGPGTSTPRSVPSYWGVVTERYKLVEYVTGERELFDLIADPNELSNLAALPESATTLGKLRAQLAELRSYEPLTTTIAWGPPAFGYGKTVRFRFFSPSRRLEHVCRLIGTDPGPWQRCGRFDATYLGLAPGAYTFQVAVERSGLPVHEPASRDFRIQRG